jgi:hypothetical protein
VCVLLDLTLHIIGIHLFDLFDIIFVNRALIVFVFIFRVYRPYILIDYFVFGVYIHVYSPTTASLSLE